MKAMLGLLTAGGIVTWIWISDAIGDTSFNLTADLFPIYLSDIGHLTIEQIGLFASAGALPALGSSWAAG